MNQQNTRQYWPLGFYNYFAEMQHFLRSKRYPSDQDCTYESCPLQFSGVSEWDQAFGSQLTPMPGKMGLGGSPVKDDTANLYTRKTKN